MSHLLRTSAMAAGLAAIAIFAAPSLAAQEANCPPYTAPILAGKTIQAGKINVTSNATELIVQADAVAPWLIRAIHIYASEKPLVTTKEKFVAPGKFPYKQTFEAPYASTFTTRIPFKDLGIEAGKTLSMAIHTEMIQLGGEEGTEIVEEETGWAEGPDAFKGKRWGWSFTYTTCVPAS